MCAELLRSFGSGVRLGAACGNASSVSYIAHNVELFVHTVQLVIILDEIGFGKAYTLKHPSATPSQFSLPPAKAFMNVESAACVAALRFPNPTTPYLLVARSE